MKKTSPKLRRTHRVLWNRWNKLVAEEYPFFPENLESFLEGFLRGNGTITDEDS